MIHAKRVLWTVLLAAAVFPVAARAQEGRGDVIYVPTPQVVVDEMLKMAKVGPRLRHRSWFGRRAHRDHGCEEVRRARLRRRS